MHCLFVQLISRYRRDALTTLLIDTYDWYILPVMNPDGYEYSNTTVIIAYQLISLNIIIIS